MKKSLLLALFAALSNAVFSQQMYRVLAENGLKLRAAPNKTAKVLAVAPFLSEVEVLVTATVFGRDIRPISEWIDTVGVLYHMINYRDSVVEVPHSGFWMECRFQGKTGFMFGGFLEMIRENHTRELNDQYRLRRVGDNECESNNPEFSKGWNWYGLFRLGDQFEVRPVKPTYAFYDSRDSSGMGDGAMNDSQGTFLRTADKVPPIYIFGTKKAWPSRVLEGKSTDRYAFDRETNATVKVSPIEEAAKNAGLVLVEIEKGVGKVYCQKRGNGELKPISINGDGKEGGFVNEIHWIGDLDGDGKADFIFESSGLAEASGFKVLFLSSLAKKGETIGPAAVLSWWYCC